MLESILKLKGTSVLSKKQQSIINGGGGTCGYTVTFTTYDFDGTAYETTQTEYGVSKADAKAATKNGGRWCCDSCGTASWLQQASIQQA